LAREARDVSGRDVFIAGSIGPLGDGEEAPRGRHYSELAQLLEGRGADLFMVETFYDLADLEAAVAALRSVSQLPIVALLSFDADRQTLAGVSARSAAARLAALDLAALGANHGAGPAAAPGALAQMGGSGKAQSVDLTDSPRARARMSGIMASVAIERLTGVETTPHLTPRDTTVNGLESQLLGAHAEGVRNILAVTGDPPEAGDYPGA